MCLFQIWWSTLQHMLVRLLFNLTSSVYSVVVFMQMKWNLDKTSLLVSLRRRALFWYFCQEASQRVMRCQWASLFACPLGFGLSVELVVKSSTGEVLSLT